MQITEKLIGRLIRPDMKGSPSPDLATSWSANDAATEWTMKLRTGVKFHDGSAFDAGDVIYTFNRVLNPENKSPARSAIKMIEKMEAVDSSTVKFSLSTPFADMPLQRWIIVCGLFQRVQVIASPLPVLVPVHSS